MPSAPEVLILTDVADRAIVEKIVPYEGAGALVRPLGRADLVAALDLARRDREVRLVEAARATP